MLATFVHKWSSCDGEGSVSSCVLLRGRGLAGGDVEGRSPKPSWAEGCCVPLAMPWSCWPARSARWPRATREAGRILLPMLTSMRRCPYGWRYSATDALTLYGWMRRIKFYSHCFKHAKLASIFFLTSTHRTGGQILQFCQSDDKFYFTALLFPRRERDLYLLLPLHSKSVFRFGCKYTESRHSV